MPTCCLKECVNRSSKQSKSDGVTFHAFPKDELRKHKWITIVRKQRQEADWIASEFSRVCSLHFRPEDTYTTKKGLRRIKKYALPYIQMTYMKPSDNVTEAAKSSNHDASTIKLEKDLENFMEWKHMGKRPRMSTTAVLRNVNMLCATPLTNTFIVEAQQTEDAERSRDLSTGASSCGSSDNDDGDDLEDVDVDEEMRYITTRVDTLEQQSKNYDKIFQEFGETVTSRLKSLPITSAIRLHKRLENVIEKFFASLPKPAETQDSSELDEFLTFKTPKKGRPTKNKSSKQATKEDATPKAIPTEPVASSSTDPTSKSPDVTFTPNRLARAQEEFNVPLSTLQTKTKPDKGSSISYGINPGSQSITVKKTASKTTQKRPFFEDPTSDSEPEKQARLDEQARQDEQARLDEESRGDGMVEITIKLEEEECIIKTEHDSDDDGDPLNFPG